MWIYKINAELIKSYLVSKKFIIRSVVFMKSTDTIHETLFQYYILRYAFRDISHLHMEKSLPNMECSKSVRVLTCIRFRRLLTFNLGTRSPQKLSS